MFDDIDLLCNSTQEEEKAYQQGIQEARTDLDVKQQIGNLGRENFTRGHNAGFACGLMLAVLEEEELFSKIIMNQNDSAERKDTLEKISELVKKMSALGNRKEDLQPETTYQKVADDDEEEEDEEQEGDSLRDSFRVTLVKLVERFVNLVVKTSINRASPPSFVPQDQWNFLLQLIQDNKAGSPDKQTAISGLIDAATKGDDENSTEQKKNMVKIDESTTSSHNGKSMKSGRVRLAATASRKPANDAPQQKKTLDEVLDW